MSSTGDPPILTPEQNPDSPDQDAPAFNLEEEKDVDFKSAVSITVTEHDADGDVEDYAPSTPSASDLQSETDDEFIDNTDLERDRGYRPSNAGNQNPVPHENMFDRYGFPAEDTDEPEAEVRRRLRKENQRTEKWRAMMFPGRDGQMHTLSEGADGARRQLEQWNRVKSNRKLKSRVRKGIPQSMRGIVWVNMCGAREKMLRQPSLYHDLLYSEKRYHDETQIWKDIWRTYRKHAQFGAVDGQESMQDMIDRPSQMQQSLFNVLKTYAIHNRGVGYCQGMGSVAALMLMHTGEDEAFWVLECLCTDPRYGMQNIWQETMPLMPLRFYQFQRLFRKLMPRLEANFQNWGLDACSMYGATQWFVTIFLATRLPFGTMLRIWDIYLNEGYKTVFRVAIGMLKYYEKDLMTSNMEEILMCMSDGMKSVQQDEFIKIVVNVKLTHAELQGFEHHFFSQGLGP